MNCIRTIPLWVALLLASSFGGTVRKVAETFDGTPWPANTSSRATGRSSLSGEAAPDAKSAGSLRLDVDFSGNGFEWAGIDAPAPIVVPGDAKTLTIRYRTSDKRCFFILKFADGWGRSTLGNEKLEWALPADPAGGWKTSTFTVPGHWVRPLTIPGFSCHNWSAQNVKQTVTFQVDDLEVETDVSGVDPATGILRTWKPNPAEQDPAKRNPPVTPLLAFALSTAEVSNVFSREKPAAAVALRNWHAATLAGNLTWRVLDGSGKAVGSGERPVSVESGLDVALPLEVERFGLYTLEAKVALTGQPDRTETLVFARVPPYADLAEAQKVASPYGINLHGGSTRMVIAPFRKAGIIWFRDYAFQFPTLLAAKGADRRYNGWPWYPALIRRYAEAGVKLLPCSQKAIQAPEVKDGKVVGRIGPDRAWVREIADFINAFPQLTHWELGNEYDLNEQNARAEELIGWKNYRAYHRKFADVLSLLGAGEVTAVEQGRAGIWPERVRQCVESGDFEKIAVVNSHHYCGVEPPETNVLDVNTGVATGRPTRLFFDALRDVKRAAEADGKRRESWLTEIGWDTLAGHVVPPYEQAVYLARGWMLAMAAGTDKCFWFYDYDAPNPKQFFDGCGLLDAQGQPKLALCALAGMTSVLPSPRYVGSIDAGPNTAGYVFESGGKLVAALWAVEGDEGPRVTFQAERLVDFLGNPLAGQSVRLTRAPVYAVGLDRGDPLYAQTAYSLHSPYLVAATAGDPVEAVLRVNNNRDKAIACRVKMALPKGWTADALEASANVAQGKTSDLSLRFTVGPDEPLGRRQVTLAVSEGGAVREIPLTVLVRTALVLQVGPIRGRPGDTVVSVKVGNTSARTLDATLRLRLPASWKTSTPEMKLAGLKPGESRELECKLAWSADWQVGESATAELDAGPGKRLVRSIIPNCLRLHRAKDLQIDGRLDDWPESARLPEWMLGSTTGAPKAKAFLAWSPEGLYAAVEVADSKLQASDPRSFWAGDCLELFIDTSDDKRQRSFEPGDHQFWFVPLVGEGRVYVGRWKRKDEIPATRYDIQGIRSAARRTPEGYVVEFLLPASLLEKFQAKAGARLGLNLNLTVKGKQLDREVYWPARKDWAVMNLPKVWGSMELVD